MNLDIIDPDLETLHMTDRLLLTQQLVYNLRNQVVHHVSFSFATTTPILLFYEPCLITVSSPTSLYQLMANASFNFGKPTRSSSW